MVTTKVDLLGITLDNPIIPASGTFGFGYEFSRFYDLDRLGAISIKGTTVEPRYGNPLPRIAEAPEGVLNAVGLQNPGMKAVIEEELPHLEKVYHKKVLANISGFAVEEYVTLAKAFDPVDQVGWLEVNISCPNVHGGGMAFGQDPEGAAAVTKAVKEVSTKPVIVKLSPNVTDIAAIAKACEEAGADGLSLVNTFLATRIDLKTRRFILANETGGLSGPAIFPIALRMVSQVSRAVDIPVIGMGGIRTCEDVLEMIMAGAACVQVGAANLTDPWACLKLVEALPETMEKYGIQSLDEIRGAAYAG